MIDSIEYEYRRYKALGESAMAQMADEALSAHPGGQSNSVATIVWHIAGNLESRFTAFRTDDGEKPWRQRDEEFEARIVVREQLMATWERGWTVLFAALAELTDADLTASVTIRGEPLRVDQALHRSLAHTAYHVGQIVHTAKALVGPEWRSLTIPRRVNPAR